MEYKRVFKHILLQICDFWVPIENGPLGPPRKKQSQKQKRKSEISRKVAKQVGEIITFARFSCTGEHFGQKKIFDLIPVLASPPLTLCNCDWLRTTIVLQNSWLSDFGGFPVTSSSMTVKSKSVLHTKLVVVASIESVLSEK